MSGQLPDRTEFVFSGVRATFGCDQAWMLRVCAECRSCLSRLSSPTKSYMSRLAACARLSVIGFTTPLVILQRMREADEREAQLRELMLLEVVGERERPTIAMPLWAAAQAIRRQCGSNGRRIAVM